MKYLVMKYLALIAGLTAFAGAAAAEQPLTTNQMRALTPAEAGRVAQSDLLSVLVPPSGFPKGMLRMVRGTSFVTPAYGSEYEGLCRRDRLELRYAWTTPEGKVEDRPMKPYGVETTAWFTDVGMTDDPADADPVWAPACHALDGKADVDWFAAKDARQARDVLLVLRKVRAQLTSGQVSLSSCDNAAPTPKCKDDVLKANKITMIEECAAPRDLGDGGACYEIWLDPDVVMVVKAKSSPTETPGDIESIVVNYYVIVT